ncbi:hypothetical protein SAMN05920897_102138 [Alkalispirochaeta americana]|uniref:Uncharacterized protein n=1 Tax=Alkalispirochaeta americana TaxID=159291 RepID=A0A1N6P5K5_9SPIO|nr:hypothetical protein [Alkalispirochaeta americana]SIP99589.1 hypothetical protein SAMN05920897_102138 [Alkalispirochaeta americana]
MSDVEFFSVSHEESLALMKHLRTQEEIIEPVLADFLLRLERRLFAVHSIEEMESLMESAHRPRQGQRTNLSESGHSQSRQRISGRKGGIS